MTYLQIKSLINDAYAKFSADYAARLTLGADVDINKRNLFFVKCIYKVLVNQDGDESKDALTSYDIRNIIVLFNKHSGSTIPIEYQQ